MTAGGVNPVDAFDDLRDASRERLLAEIGTIKHQYDISGVAKIADETAAENRVALARIAELEMSLLHARDYAQGAAAEVGELRANLALAQRQTQQARSQLHRTLGTRTWKIGNMVLLPVRLVRRVLRAR